MATPAHYMEARLWLADALEQSANWRDGKREEYPDDVRNGRAAVALRNAAYYIRAADSSAGVQRFAELIHDCNASDIDLVGAHRDRGLPGSESQRAAARYFFDSFAANPDAESHEMLLDDLYRASLRDLREQDVTAGSPLARRLAKDEPVTANRVAAPRATDDDARARQVAQLAEISRLLVVLAETAKTEADAEGRLAGPLQPTSLPLLRRQLRIAATALVAFGGPRLEQVRRLVDEPPLFVAPTTSGVVTALDDVNVEVERIAGEVEHVAAV